MHWFRWHQGAATGRYGEREQDAVQHGARNEELSGYKRPNAADLGLQDDDEWGVLESEDAVSTMARWHDLERGGPEEGSPRRYPQTGGGDSQTRTTTCAGEAQRLYIMHHRADTSGRPMAPRFPHSHKCRETPRPVSKPYDLSIRPRLQGSDRGNSFRLRTISDAGA